MNIYYRQHFQNIMYSLGALTGSRVKFVKAHKSTYMIELLAMADILGQAIWYLSGRFSFGNSKSFAGMAQLMDEGAWGLYALIVALVWIGAIMLKSPRPRIIALWGMLMYYSFMLFSLILSGTGTVGIVNRFLLVIFISVSILAAPND